MSQHSYNIVYTGGTFDLFHAGHVNFLYKCRQLAGRNGEVVVSLNPDEFIRQYKGAPPIHSYKQREVVLNACQYVSRVVCNIGGADSKIAIDEVNPTIIAIGTDWCGRDYYAQMGFTQQWLDQREILLVYMPYTQDISTTLIKQRVLER